MKFPNQIFVSESHCQKSNSQLVIFSIDFLLYKITISRERKFKGHCFLSPQISITNINLQTTAIYLQQILSTVEERFLHQELFACYQIKTKNSGQRQKFSTNPRDLVLDPCLIKLSMISSIIVNNSKSQSYVGFSCKVLGLSLPRQGD